MHPRVACLVAAILFIPIWTGPVAAQRSEALETSSGSFDSAPRIVSPGAVDAIQEASRSCPTYLWAGLRDAEAYELRVYREPSGQAFDEASMIETEVPGGATGWSPPGDGCLEPGLYAWRVRGVSASGPTDWSEAGWFEIPDQPTVDDVALALDVLKRHRRAVAIPDESAGGSDRPVAERARYLETGAIEAAPDAVGRLAGSEGTDAQMQVAGLAEVVNLEVSGEIRGDAGGINVPALVAFSNTVTFGEVLAFDMLTLDLEVTDLLKVNTIEYSGSDLAQAGGGVGFVEIVSATVLDVDDNVHVCNNGGLVRGLRLKAQPSDQLAFELICTEGGG
jgi:hypothetical protein